MVGRGYFVCLSGVYLVVVRAVFAAVVLGGGAGSCRLAAATRGAGAGAAGALIGVIEAAALELDAAGVEHLGGRLAARGADNLGGLGHGMLDLEHVAAARALVIVTRHDVLPLQHKAGDTC